MNTRVQRELSEFDQAHRAHAAYYVALLAREAPKLQGGGTADGGKAQARALRVLGVELGNLLGALDTALRRVLGETGGT